MKLVNADSALVSREKIVDYLLSSTHRDGRHKAAFFSSFGFRPEAWEELATALVNHARSHDVVKEEATPFGIRYVVHGRIEVRMAADSGSGRYGSSKPARIYPAS